MESAGRLAESKHRGPDQDIQPRAAIDPLQRSSLPESWLVDFGGVAADEVDRLGVDLRLYQVLVQANFTGPAWNSFADALVRYAFQVMKAWVGTGKIFGLCHQRGYRTERRQDLDQEAVEALAAMTVAVALRYFQTSVLPLGRWDPELGAGLRTYFMGQCLQRFPREYARWVRDNVPLGLVAEMPDLAVTAESDPAHHVEVRLRLDEAIATSPRAARILALTTAGFTLAEAATRLDLSDSAAESILYRHRQRLGQ